MPTDASIAAELPARPGPAPQTSRPRPDRPPTPHAQLSQNAPLVLQEALFERARALPDVTVGVSQVSVPGARAFQLAEEAALGPAEAFQAGREFAHLHPAHDGSLHVTLPAALYEHVQVTGWGEPHPVSGTMMIYGPRDPSELEIVWKLLLASYQFARGKEPDSAEQGS
jgi:luciferase-like monooxygenase